MSFIFAEKYSYPFNEILKKYQGKFNPETKEWSVPLLNKKAFMEEKRKIELQQKALAEKVWQESCLDCGVKFCKKGTEEYLQVLELFKLKMKN